MRHESQPQDTVTIDPAEIDRFSALAETWWDPNGPMAPLHKFNPTRLYYLRHQIATHFNRNIEDLHFAKGLRVVDIGCGGGLISEPIAQFGAKVLGIDAAEKNVKTAYLHANQQYHLECIDLSYRHCSAEDLVAEQHRFDIVLSLEVVEHVADVSTFLHSLSQLVTPGGILVLATLNRTIKSLVFAKICAEYILGWLPKGTHQWQKFIKPSELEQMMSQHPLIMHDLSGLSFDPIRNSWHISRDVSINYLMSFKQK